MVDRPSAVTERLPRRLSSAGVVVGVVLLALAAGIAFNPVTNTTSGSDFIVQHYCGSALLSYKDGGLEGPRWQPRSCRAPLRVRRVTGGVAMAAGLLVLGWSLVSVRNQ